MLNANNKALRKELPCEVKLMGSTCQCGTCSGGNGTCKGCQDKNSDLAKVKKVYSK